MNLNLKGKTAILLGSSKGIGFGVARELLAEGSRIIISSRSKTNLDSAEKQLRNEFPGCDLHIFQADTSKKEDILSLINFIKKEFEIVHMVLNNTGGPPSGEFLKISEDQWEQSFESLLMSTIRIINGLFPYLAEDGSSIVNILSRSAKVYLPNLVLSNTFRPAIAGLAKTLSIELGKQNVRINNVCPGIIDTERQNELLTMRSAKEGIEPEIIMSSLIKEIPLGRIGKAQDLSSLICFLFSQKSSYITGQTIIVDGGNVKSI